MLTVVRGVQADDGAALMKAIVARAGDDPPLSYVDQRALHTQTHTYISMLFVLCVPRPGTLLRAARLATMHAPAVALAHAWTDTMATWTTIAPAHDTAAMVRHRCCPLVKQTERNVECVCVCVCVSVCMYVCMCVYAYAFLSV
jgi:hypothetical protein